MVSRDESCRQFTTDSAESGLRRAAAGISRILHCVPELWLITTLYLLYTGSRLLASRSFSHAADRARDLQKIESHLGLNREHAINSFFAAHAWAGLAGSYWYATCHYVVTVAVLVWLYLRHRAVYPRARTALAGATFIALTFYLLMPTAPPRLLDGEFVDVMSRDAAHGWWSGAASALRGFGGLTDQLAAFPSMHAGWALWVALAVAAGSRSSIARTLGFAYAAITAVVVVGTGNHWVIDVLAGWLIVGGAWRSAAALDAARKSLRPS